MTKPSGKKPIPIWIDGKKFESSAEALVELNLTGSNDRRHAYYRALDGSGQFEGHTVSRLSPDFKPYAIPEPRKRVPGEVLLVEPCRHRLGVWQGGQW